MEKKGRSVEEVTEEGRITDITFLLFVIRHLIKTEQIAGR